MTVYDGILYVASPTESRIEMFDTMDNLTALGTFVAFSELFYLVPPNPEIDGVVPFSRRCIATTQEHIVVHEEMMYIATDDFPYLLKVPMLNVTNDPAFHTGQWQPTGKLRVH